MSDTIKIQRPLFSRRRQDAGGRVKHDSRGNGVWIQTRADDAATIAISPELSVIEDAPRAQRPAADAATPPAAPAAPKTPKTR